MLYTTSIATVQFYGILTTQRFEKDKDQEEGMGINSYSKQLNIYSEEERERNTLSNRGIGVGQQLKSCTPVHALVLKTPV